MKHMSYVRCQTHLLSLFTQLCFSIYFTVSNNGHRERCSCKYIHFLNHNTDVGSDTVGATCCLQIKDNKDRWEVEGRGGGLMSQFHCDNGARAVGMVSIVRSHCASADRERLHHILSQSLLILGYKRAAGGGASKYFNG